MLPDLDGFEVYRRLATGGDRLPVLFLTARDATEDRVHGLTLGADDYVGKPFSLEELVARVRAVLRRTRATQDEHRCCASRTCELDEDAREVRRGRSPDRADADRVQPAALPAGQRRAGASARPRSSTTCGATTSAATPAWSRPTSATCARRSTRGEGTAADPHRPRVRLRHSRSAEADVSLRIRLTAITVLLVAIGPGRRRVATHRYIESFMIDRLDQQLTVAAPASSHRRPGALPGGSYAGRRRPDHGRVLCGPVTIGIDRQRARTPGEGSRRVFRAAAATASAHGTVPFGRRRTAPRTCAARWLVAAPAAGRERDASAS